MKASEMQDNCVIHKGHERNTRTSMVCASTLWGGSYSGHCKKGTGGNLTLTALSIPSLLLGELSQYAE